jgi:2',3'-cyclic-nucleotide 2'-phosphodiesterase (5'-nucleotidase family)
VTFTDYVEAGTMLARELKSKGCHCVIALTHMRTPNDVRLAENVAEIDLILGGHDHVYEKKKVGLFFFCFFFFFFFFFYYYFFFFFLYFYLF